MGIARVDYIFKIEPLVFVTTKVQVPRNKLVRLIPWVSKTRTQELKEQLKTLPEQGLRQLELSGKTLRIVITVDTLLFQVVNSRVTT
jgi:hypothetical protein